MISDNAYHTSTVEETSGKEVESVEPPQLRKENCLADTSNTCSGWFLEGSIVEKEFKTYLDNTDFTKDENPLKFLENKSK